MSTRYFVHRIGERCLSPSKTRYFLFEKKVFLSRLFGLGSSAKAGHFSLPLFDRDSHSTFGSNIARLQSSGNRFSWTGLIRLSARTGTCADRRDSTGGQQPADCWGSERYDTGVHFSFSVPHGKCHFFFERE